MRSTICRAVLSTNRSFSSQQDMSHHQERKARKQTKPEHIYGVNPVLASLSANRRDFQKLFLSVAEKDISPKSTSKIE